MKIQAEVSLYPLRTADLEPVVRRFIAALSRTGMVVLPGTMSTLVQGDSGSLFPHIGACFEEVCRDGEVVLACKFSNACPERLDD